MEWESALIESLAQVRLVNIKIVGHFPVLALIEEGSNPLPLRETQNLTVKLVELFELLVIRVYCLLPEYWVNLINLEQ